MADQRPEWAGERLWLHGALVEGEDFSGRHLRHPSVANGSRLVRCDFRQTRIEGGVLGGGLQPSEYVDCVFDGSHMRRVMPGRATFRACSFRNVKIYDFTCIEAQFIDCVFSGSLQKVIFSAKPWEGDIYLARVKNEYQENDFSGAQMKDVAFRGGIDLGQQQFPADPDYLILRNVAASMDAALKEIERWPDKSHQRQADIVLRVLESELRTGQEDIFINRALLVGKLPPELADRLVAVLTISRP